MSPLNWKVVTLSLGLHCAVSFALCVALGLLVPPSLHASRLLEMVLPGFQWLSPASFLLGLAESLLIGVYLGLVFTPIYNLVLRGFGHAG
jgi:hypothetical protein